MTETRIEALCPRCGRWDWAEWVNWGGHNSASSHELVSVCCRAVVAREVVQVAVGIATWQPGKRRGS